MTPVDALRRRQLLARAVATWPVCLAHNEYVRPGHECGSCVTERQDLRDRRTKRRASSRTTNER